MRGFKITIFGIITASLDVRIVNVFFSCYSSAFVSGDQTITYYVTVSIYRTRQNAPTSQYVLFNKLSNIEPPPRRCTTAR